jgi:hypothetical protein
MTADDIEEQIYDWRRKHYPGVTDVECHRTIAPELRAVLFTSIVEGEISNGGLPQLLWNTFHHWRAVLDDAEMGYQLFGATQHCEAIRVFRTLFERYGSECRHYMEQSSCGEWCGYAYDLMKSQHQKLFFTDSGYQKRKAWIAANEQRLLQLVAA